MTNALNGVRVIDMTQALAGPYCTMLLGDLGADVIKVEPPGAGDASRGWGPPFLAGESAYFLAVNRNKRGITLDFTTPEGIELMSRLLTTADVFVFNLPRLESLRKRGLDYDTWRERNPGIIYAGISGFGHTGPYAGRPGYDLLAQGLSGTMAMTGEPDGEPTRFPTPMADITAGVYTAIGILTALYVREGTGQGQFVDVALLDGQVTWLANLAANYFATGQRPLRLGNAHPSLVPYQPFRAADQYFIVAVGSERLWARFCQALDIEQTLGADPRFATNADRVRNRAALVAQLERLFATQPAAHWLERLETASVPCGPISEIDEALNHPQLQARRMIVELEHATAGSVRSLGTPIHFSGTPVAYHRPPPRLGEHTDEVLAELGYNAGEIGRLRERGVVGPSA